MISFRSGITRKVLGYFFLHEDVRMYINQMARRFEVDSGNLTRKLNDLEKEGILKSEVRGMERYFSLNRDFPLYSEYKKIFRRSMGIEETLRKALKEVPGLQRAVLFGSYAANQMNQHSDIDVLLVGDYPALKVAKIIASVQKTVDRPINCLQLDPREFQKKKDNDPLLKNIFKSRHIEIL